MKEVKISLTERLRMRENEIKDGGWRLRSNTGETEERAEDIELKWPLGAHSSILLSLP